MEATKLSSDAPRSRFRLRYHSQMYPTIVTYHLIFLTRKWTRLQEPHLREQRPPRKISHAAATNNIGWKWFLHHLLMPVSPRYLFDTLHVVFAVRIHKISLFFSLISRFPLCIDTSVLTAMTKLWRNLEVQDVGIWSEEKFTSLPGWTWYSSRAPLVMLSHCLSLGTNPRPLICSQSWNNPPPTFYFLPYV